jgi:transposase
MSRIDSKEYCCQSKSTGRPGYHPTTMLKIYLYGYLNRIHSSRRLEQEAGSAPQPRTYGHRLKNKSAKESLHNPL